MLQQLEEKSFFSSTEEGALSTLGLAANQGADARELFAYLLLAPLLELCVADGATTTAEFEIIEECLGGLEHDFELASKEDLETLGTTMGLLPFVKGEWSDEQFLTARRLLATAIERLDEPDQHAVRNWIAKSALAVADASGGVLHLLAISKSERSVLHAIIEDLQLGKCAEGLHLIGRTER